MLNRTVRALDASSRTFLADVLGWLSPHGRENLTSPEAWLTKRWIALLPTHKNPAQT